MTSHETKPECSSTKQDVRDFYQLKSTRTIENWMRAGLIPYVKIGRVVRFNLEEVQRALEARFGRNKGGAK